MADHPTYPSLEESRENHSERQRRMKRLLHQLYEHEIVAGPPGTSRFNAKGLIASVIIVFIVVFGITTLYNFNIFITLEERVFEAKGHIDDTLQRRSNLFTNLINLTLNQSALEQEVFRHVADVRVDLMRRDTSSTTPSADASSEVVAAGAEGGADQARHFADAVAGVEGSSLAKLLAVVEHYPEIKSSATYQQLMDQLVEIEDRIITKRDLFNDEVRVYNTLITSFPWYILARITGFKRHEYYSLDLMAKSDHWMQPGSAATPFHRLLPLDSDHGQTRATGGHAGTTGEARQQ
ncbi:MAG: LemA family protein [Magnetococcales bacterium]|nr:LemA family protein [Magnetococcales bacterium]MBF0151962.1 LemA family protein [Magnetococcales bacterium]